MYKNLDLDNIVTPINAEALNSALIQSGYDSKKTKFLVEGFRHGFSIEYDGPKTNIQQTANNFKFRIGDEVDLWNKVMNEVKLSRYAGPFDQVPYQNFIQSPIGLVPKDKGTKSRLIFHLS